MAKKGSWVLLVALLVVTGAGVAAAGSGEPEKDTHIFIMGGQSWLGVQIGDVTGEKARELKLPRESGALVEDVEEESPAAKAGLQANDVILSFDGETVRSAAHLARLVQETPAGRKVSLQISRGGQTRQVEVSLEGRRGLRGMPGVHMGRIAVPPVPPLPPMPEFDFEVYPSRPRLGISADELTPQLADYFGVKQGKGILVREVVAGSAADKAGLKAGDVIVRVDEQEVGDVQGLRRALRRQGEAKEVTLAIVRDRREQSVKVTLESEEPQRYGLRRQATAEGWIDLDREALERAAAEAEAAARTIEQRLREGQGKLERLLESQQLEMKMREVEERTRAVERKIREQVQSEKFKEKLRKIEQKAREVRFI